MNAQEVEEVENFEVEIFATKELVINELGSVKGKKLIVLEDQQVAIKNLEALRAKHEVRSEELIALEKLTPAELKELKLIKSALGSPRILIDKYVKDGVSVIAHCSSQFKSVWGSLISINKPLEDKVSEKIKLEDQRKKDEKAEQERLEQEKEDKIRKSIDDFESNSMLIVQKMTINSKENDLISLNNLSTSMVDVEPFDILLEKAQDRVTEAYRVKVEDLDIAEAQRLKNEKLEADNKKAKELSDLQAKRLKELAPLMAFVKEVDITNLSALPQIEYDTILGEASLLFESDVKQKKREQEKKDADAKAEKDAIFEIRKNRLAEIGITRNEDGWYCNDNNDVIYNELAVSEYNTIEFESLMLESKKSIQTGKDKAQKKLAFETRKTYFESIVQTNKFFTHIDSEVMGRISFVDLYGVLSDDDFDIVCKEFLSCAVVMKDLMGIEPVVEFCESEPTESIDNPIELKSETPEDLRLSLEDANRLKLENEARVKRLAKDKASLSLRIKESVVGLSAGCENEEISLFIQESNTKIENLRKELLTELENL